MYIDKINLALLRSCTWHLNSIVMWKTKKNYSLFLYRFKWKCPTITHPTNMHLSVVALTVLCLGVEFMCCLHLMYVFIF